MSGFGSVQLMAGSVSTALLTFYCVQLAIHYFRSKLATLLIKRPFKRVLNYYRKLVSTAPYDSVPALRKHLSEKLRASKLQDWRDSVFFTVCASAVQRAHGNGLSMAYSLFTILARYGDFCSAMAVIMTMHDGVQADWPTSRPHAPHAPGVPQIRFISKESDCRANPEVWRN